MSIELMEMLIVCTILAIVFIPHFLLGDYHRLNDM